MRKSRMRSLNGMPPAGQPAPAFSSAHPPDVERHGANSTAPTASSPAASAFGIGAATTIARAATTSGQAHATSRVVFEMVYSNPRKKRDGSLDGFVVVCASGRVSLLDAAGAPIGHRSWRADDANLANGSSLLLAGWECALGDAVCLDDFDANRLFSGGESSLDGTADAPAAEQPRTAIFRRTSLSAAAPRPTTRGPSSSLGGAAPTVAAAASGARECARSFPSVNPTSAIAVTATPSSSCTAATASFVESSMRSKSAPSVAATADAGEYLLNRGDDGENPVKIDGWLLAHLRAHQREGVQFMYDCVRGRRCAVDGSPLCGCILAHSMGLGKTLQALALIYSLLRATPHGKPLLKKALIVCPASLCHNWSAECDKWFGAQRLKAHGVASGKEAAESVRDFALCPPRRLLVISYETLRMHAEMLKTAPIGLIICDEGHRLKNAVGNKTTSALRSIPNASRIILTGTPMQNDLDELWAMCDFVVPGALPDRARFRARFSAPIEAGRQGHASEHERSIAAERSAELRSMTECFIQRRGREEIDKLLPSRHEIVVFCPLSDTQRLAYLRALDSLRDFSSLDVGAQLTAISRLRALCSGGVSASADARDGDEDSDDARSDLGVAVTAATLAKACWPSKLRVLMRLLVDAHAAGDRVVICAQFQHSLNLLEKAIGDAGWSCLRVDGKVGADKRQELVDAFNSPRSRDFAFLLSTRAGGTGFNLVSANRLVIYDPDWNPAADEQAMARVFRDGQRRAVTIWRLFSTGTLEEKMLQRQIFKLDLASGVTADTAPAENRFSSLELKALFSYNGGCRSDTLEMLLHTTEARAGTETEDEADAHAWRAQLPDALLQRALQVDSAAAAGVSFACDVAVLHRLRARLPARDPAGDKGKSSINAENENLQRDAKGASAMRRVSHARKIAKRPRLSVIDDEEDEDGSA